MVHRLSDTSRKRTGARARSDRRVDRPARPGAAPRRRAPRTAPDRRPTGSAKVVEDRQRLGRRHAHALVAAVVAARPARDRPGRRARQQAANQTRDAASIALARERDRASRVGAPAKAPCAVLAAAAASSFCQSSSNTGCRQRDALLAGRRVAMHGEVDAAARITRRRASLRACHPRMAAEEERHTLPGGTKRAFTSRSVASFMRSRSHRFASADARLGEQRRLPVVVACR